MFEGAYSWYMKEKKCFSVLKCPEGRRNCPCSLFSIIPALFIIIIVLPEFGVTNDSGIADGVGFELDSARALTKCPPCLTSGRAIG
jgi:hypothetical protein